jgi:hypothetical protein
MEHPRRPAVANHVHRTARLGTSVMSRESWYKSSLTRVGRLPRLSFIDPTLREAVFRPSDGATAIDALGAAIVAQGATPELADGDYPT